MSDVIIEAAARAEHEANRAWCLAHGDTSQPAWEDAPGWQRSSAINGVQGVIAGNGPRESHACWLAEKEADGWKYGPVKDPEAKEHPCFVPYDELPPTQAAKDGIFVAVVRSVLVAGGLLANPPKMPTFDETMAAATPPVRNVLQFFRFAHLPPHLQHRSKIFADLAVEVANGPQNPETTVALRKLLEAKDAAVRALFFV